MKFETREYQEITIKKAKDSLNNGKNTLIVLPTGSGKAYILARITKDLINEIPKLRILFAVDREILVRQLNETINEIVGNIPIGIACSSVSKDIEINKQITIGTRQTIINHINKDMFYNLIIADEAHLWPLPSEEEQEKKSQFQQIYETCKSNNQKLRLLGCTATPYSLQAGYIYGKCHKPGLKPYFDELCHKITYKELTDKGHLCSLVGKIAENDINLDNVKITAGEYNLNSLSVEMELHVQTIKDAIDQYCKGRKSILIFCVSISHAEAIHDILPDSIMLHSGMDKLAREEAMLSFKSGEKRIAISVNILSIGFDHPPVDCGILARPTKSTSMCLQQIGRILRTFKNKKDCLLIDVTNNIAEHFPTFDLDNPHVVIPTQKKVVEENQKKKTIEIECDYKICPSCGQECHNSTRYCSVCSYFWEDKFMHAKYLPKMFDVKFDKKEVSKEPIKYPIHSMTIEPHESKISKKVLMKIIFEIGDFFQTKKVFMWFCFPDYYSGFALDNSIFNWSKFCNIPFPDEVEMGVVIALENFRKPTHITCKPQNDNPNFLEIVDVLWENEEDKKEDPLYLNSESKIYEDDVPF